MDNPSYIALSRQVGLLRQLDVIAHNLANMNTTGYKNESLLFKEHLADRHTAPALSYVHDDTQVTNTRTGAHTPTGNPLDLAISGEGYFKVETPAGVRYTRDGRLGLSTDGILVNKLGYPVLDEQDNPMQPPPGATTLSIDRAGVFEADGLPVGRIAVVTFENLQALQKTQSGLYRTEAFELPAEGAEVVQYMVEQSNVEPILEMTQMIQVLRDFQAGQRLLESEHERMIRAIRELPKIDAA